MLDFLAQDYFKSNVRILLKNSTALSMMCLSLYNDVPILFLVSRMRKEIRKLDKLNSTMSGVFNPNGLEIISNSEVWDLRTFHLLKTVPGLDQCRVSEIYIIYQPQLV